MLLDGELGGRRLLAQDGRADGDDASGDQPRAGNLGPGTAGLTFGSQSPGRNGALGSVGEYSWGALPGWFWIDPKEDMVTIFMIQILPHEGLTYGGEVTLAYQSIVD
jgi:CubicO group peptidase (beta-lactamase class C family)